MNKQKEQHEAIKKQILIQNNKNDINNIICGSANKVIVMEKVNGIWKQMEYSAL